MQHQPQAQFAEAIAVVANTGAPMLVDAYKHDSDSHADLKWERVWAAWEAFRIAHGAYAQSIESGDTPSPETVLRTYCALVGVVPAESKHVVAVPGVCSE